MCRCVTRVTGAAVVAAISLLLLVPLTRPARAAVPNRLYGTATLNGQPAPVGTAIIALTGGKPCGSTTVVQTAISGTTYPYKLDVPDAGADAACLPGAVLTFTIGGQTAAQTYTLDDIASFSRLDLTAPGTPNVPASSTANGPTRTVTLAAGCADVTSTFPDSTAPATIAAAITPTTALQAIWRYDAAAKSYRGFSPTAGGQAGSPNDLTAINRNDVLKICTAGAATLTAPV